MTINANTASFKETSEPLRRYRFLLIVPAALITILVLASAGRAWPASLVTFCLSSAVALASAAAGALIGFLFGIPVRWIRGLNEESDASNLPYKGNTSLEQISDWLVKILVGVGLVQLTAAPTALGALIDEISAGFESNDGRVLTGSIIVVSAIWGFLFSYLATRTSLPQILTASETAERVAALDTRVHEVAAALDTRVHEVDTRVDELKESIRKQEEHDASALQVAYDALSEGPKVGEGDLVDILSAATPSVRTDVFMRAVDRRISLRKFREDERVAIEGLIPVFRALVNADPRYHSYHAQLGLSLMEMRSPNFREAERSFTQAIELRHAASLNWTLFYEWNRALCRIIQLGPTGATRAESDAIMADLGMAIRNDHLRRRTNGDKDSFARDIDRRVSEWLDATGRRFELFDHGTN